MHLNYSVYLLCTESINALFSKTFVGVYSPLQLYSVEVSLHEVETWKALTSAVLDWAKEIKGATSSNLFYYEKLQGKYVVMLFNVHVGTGRGATSNCFSSELGGQDVRDWFLNAF